MKRKSIYLIRVCQNLISSVRLTSENVYCGSCQRRACLLRFLSYRSFNVVEIGNLIRARRLSAIFIAVMGATSAIITLLRTTTFPLSMCRRESEAVVCRVICLCARILWQGDGEEIREESKCGVLFAWIRLPGHNMALVYNVHKRTKMQICNWRRAYNKQVKVLSPVGTYKRKHVRRVQ